MHALASRGLTFLQGMNTDRVINNQGSGCNATFRVGAGKKGRRTSPSWPCPYSPPAIEDTDGLFPDSRQNEKPISEIVDHFVAESGNARTYAGPPGTRK